LAFHNLNSAIQLIELNWTSDCPCNDHSPALGVVAAQCGLVKQQSKANPSRELLSLGQIFQGQSQHLTTTSAYLSQNAATVKIKYLYNIYTKCI